MIRTLVLLAALIAFQVPAHAQARYYERAEIEALLAPVALYPDPLLSHVLIAATYPDDVRAAAAWSRANPQLAGEDAVRSADSMPWPESVRALLAFPDLLQRMEESPQWTADLGEAFLAQELQVMEAVQGLRRLALAAGHLQPGGEYLVQQQGQVIAINPARPQAIFVPYYNPYVVYGPWWSNAYRPVFWRPWSARPAVFVSAKLFSRSLDWQRPGSSHAAARRIAVQQAQPVTIHNHVGPAARAGAARPGAQGAQLHREPSRARELEQHQAERRTPGREHRIDSARPVPLVSHAHATRSTTPVAQISPQVQHPVQSRVQVQRPAAVQPPSQLSGTASTAVQGASVQQRGGEYRPHRRHN